MYFENHKLEIYEILKDIVHASQDRYNIYEGAYYLSHFELLSVMAEWYFSTRSQ